MPRGFRTRGGTPWPTGSLAAVPPDQHEVAWTEATRQWLEAIAGRIGESFAVYESDWVQLLTVRDEEFAGCLLRQADYSRAYLMEEFTEVVSFDQPGKLVVMACGYYGWRTGAKTAGGG